MRLKAQQPIISDIFIRLWLYSEQWTYSELQLRWYRWVASEGSYQQIHSYKYEHLQSIKHGTGHSLFNLLYFKHALLWSCTNLIFSHSVNRTSLRDYPITTAVRFDSHRQTTCWTERAVISPVSFSAPSEVLAIRPENASQNSVTLLWHEPDRPNGVILEYDIKYHEKVLSWLPHLYRTRNSVVICFWGLRQHILYILQKTLMWNYWGSLGGGVTRPSLYLENMSSLSSKGLRQSLAKMLWIMPRSGGWIDLSG